MKILKLWGAAMLLGAGGVLFAGPHGGWYGGRYYGNNGLALANGIVDLVLRAAAVPVVLGQPAVVTPVVTPVATPVVTTYATPVVTPVVTTYATPVAVPVVAPVAAPVVVTPYPYYGGYNYYGYGYYCGGYAPPRPYWGPRPHWRPGPRPGPRPHGYR